MSSFNKTIKSLKIDLEDIKRQISTNDERIAEIDLEKDQIESHSDGLRSYASEIESAIRLLEGAFDRKDS